MMKELILAGFLLFVALPAIGQTFVQTQNNFSSTAVTSLTVSITTTAGNLLVVAVEQGTNNTDTMLVSDSAGNTYTQTTSGYVSQNSTSRAALYWTGQNVGAVTSVKVTFSTGGGTTNCEIIVFEVSGMAVSSAEDSSVNSTNAGSTSLTSGSLTTTNANDILIFFNRTGANQTSWTAGTSYTIPNNNNASGNSGSNVRMAMQYEIVSSTQSGVTTSMSHNGSSTEAGIFAGFKASGGAAAPAGMNKREKLEMLDQGVAAYVDELNIFAFQECTPTNASCTQGITLCFDGGLCKDVTLSNKPVTVSLWTQVAGFRTAASIGTLGPHAPPTPLLIGQVFQ